MEIGVGWRRRSILATSKATTTERMNSTISASDLNETQINGFGNGLIWQTSIQKSIAASSGAILTSLFVTPLDVAKTRLQSQVPTTRLSASTTAANYCKCTHFQLSNGLMDHMIPKFRSPCLVCSPNQSVLLRGTYHALTHITKTEGITALWSGLPPTLLIAVPSTVFYFTSYDSLLYLGRQNFSSIDSVLPLLAGSIARIIAASIVAPLELLRTRIQSDPNSNGLIKSCSRAIKRDGYLSLWRGLSATLARDVPFSAIYWTSYENSKRWFSQFEKLSAIEKSFLSGGISGLVAATITTPFDVVKTRQQIELYSVDGVAVKNKGMRMVLKDIYKESGIRGLSTGMTARLAKIAPACAIMISSYELGKHYFGVNT